MFDKFKIKGEKTQPENHGEKDGHHKNGNGKSLIAAEEVHKDGEVGW